MLDFWRVYISGVTTAIIGRVTDSGPCCCEGDQLLCCRDIQVAKKYIDVGNWLGPTLNILVILRFNGYVFIPKLDWVDYFLSLTVPFLEKLEVQTA